MYFWYVCKQDITFEMSEPVVVGNDVVCRFAIFRTMMNQHDKYKDYYLQVKTVKNVQYIGIYKCI